MFRTQGWASRTVGEGIGDARASRVPETAAKTAQTTLEAADTSVGKAMRGRGG